MDTETNPDPDDLRASVRDFRHPRATDGERQDITEWWGQLGIPNQFAAMLRAAEIEKRQATR